MTIYVKLRSWPFKIAKEKVKLRHIFYFRYYVQLPTVKAHQYHDQFPTAQVHSTFCTKPEDILQSKQEPAVVVKEVQSADSVYVTEAPSLTTTESPHIDPKVAEKIRELVSHGIVNAYVIRQNLRSVNLLYSTLRRDMMS